MEKINKNPIIKACELAIGYKACSPVIQDFTAIIESGQLIGIFGANGAGKTTLLRCLLGLIKPLKGNLYILNRYPTRGDPQIGYMPQALPDLPFNINGIALLEAAINGHRWGVPWINRQTRIHMQSIIELTKTQNLVKQPFKGLSGGEKRRLLLAQALLGNPRILLLDEPFSNLDPHYQYTFVELLVQVQKVLGTTLLLTAHDMNPLLGAMNHVLYLAGGKAIMGSVADIMNNTVLSHLYGSAIEVIRTKGRIFVIHSSTGQIENVACH